MRVLLVFLRYRRSSMSSCTATASVTVTSAPAANYITVTPNIESGISPLTVTFRIDGTFTITNSQISVAGPGAVEWLSSAVDEYTAKITGDGVYIFTARVTAADGTVYEDTAVVTVLSRTEMDRLLKAKWGEMKSKLAGQDVEGAVSYFVSTSQERYRDIFTALSTRLPELVQNMQDIQLIYLKNNAAKYRIRKNELYGGQTLTITYYIYFEVDTSGIWRIGLF